MTDGVRRLSHEEAEMLISARMDEQLDRTDSRALLVHLQTCEACRAFAVQSEVLGRELSALPVLPPSTLVDRQIREAIGKGRSRWSLGPLLPAAGGSGGLRVAVGALAMLTLVSVFLLVRMAGDQSNDSPSIDAPNGGVAQQLDRTPTEGAEAPGAVGDPTETARVIVPPTLGNDATDAGAPTAPAGGSTEVPIPTSDEPTSAQVEPTGTLDSGFVYTITETRTPTSGAQPPDSTSEPEPTEALDDVSVAAVMADDATPAEEATGQSPVSEPTDVASPTATPAEDTPTAPAETATIPVDVPTEEPAQATEAATSAPANEAPATTTPEPTATPTPIDLSVEATEELPQPTTPAVSDETTETIAVESPENSVTPGPPDAAPTEAPPPQPTQTPVIPAPAETQAPPFAQPTIAPISGQTGSDQGVGEPSDVDDDESPQIEFNDDLGDDGNDSDSADDDGQIVESAGIQGQGDAGQSGDDNGTGGSPPIVPSDDTTVADGVGGDNGQDGSAELQQPTAVPTVDDSVAPAGLDLSATVTGLPAGTTSPTGRLEFSPGLNLYAVFAPDGQLAVANLGGELVVTLGSGDLPVWSGSGLMFRTGDQVGIWNSDTGSLSFVQASEIGASTDVPIGGNGTSFYFLRSYPASGIAEIRSATIDGQDNGVVWTSNGVTLAAERPLYSENGVYLPTDSEWLLIDWQGGETSLGANTYGALGVPVLSPGGGLLAYSAGNQVVVAWTYAPGTAVATAPFGATGGYAFATSGEEIVVSDGSSLRVISYLGANLGTLSGNQPIGGVFWISDTIYYLQIGEDAALKSTGLAAIQQG